MKINSFAALSAVAIFCIFFVMWSFGIKNKCKEINLKLRDSIELIEQSSTLRGK